MPSANSHSRGLGDDPGAREGAVAVRREQAAGMVEVEVAERDDVDRAGSKPAARSAGRIGSPADAALRRAVVVHALADAGLDQDAPGGRLDEQAVERLGQRGVRVELVGDEPLPHRPRHRPEDRARVGA